MTRICGAASLAAALLLAGCQSLPDTQPFTDATVSLRSAVAAGGTAVVAELKRSPVAGMDTQAEALDRAWQIRTKTMTALVDYAHSLQAIVNAGNKGETSAQKLADAANTLLQTLGPANLAATAGGTLALDTFKFAFGQIARARAAKSLEVALAEMQPAIDRIAELFAADLADLDLLVQVAIDSQRDRLADENQSQIGYRRQILATQKDLQNITAGELAARKAPNQLSKTEDLKRLDELLAAQATWYADYTARQSATAARGRAASEMAGVTRLAFADWAAAHAQLLAAIRARRTLSVAELAEATKRIHALVDRYREL